MVASGEHDPASMTTKRGQPVNRIQYCVNVYRAAIVAPCVGLVMFGIGVNLDFVTDGLQTVVSDVILYFALSIFIVEFVLEVIYGDRRIPFFKSWLAFHGLVLLFLFVLQVMTLASGSSPEIQAIQPLRLITLLRVADIFALIHRHQKTITTAAVHSRRALAMLLLLAFYSSLIVAYFIAILLRVKSILFVDDQFDSCTGTFLMMLPVGLLFSMVYVLLSLQIAKAKDSGRDSEESDEEKLAGEGSGIAVADQSNLEPAVAESLTCTTELADNGDDPKDAGFETAVADSLRETEEQEARYAQDARYLDEQDADAQVLNANLLFPLQLQETYVSAVLPELMQSNDNDNDNGNMLAAPELLQSNEPAPEVVGMSEAIAASREEKQHTVRLAL